MCYRALITALCTLAIVSPFAFSQTPTRAHDLRESSQSKMRAKEIEGQKMRLLGDLKGIDADADNLDRGLARASVETSIADAAWDLDKYWSEGLLERALDMTLPEAPKPDKPANDEPVGAQPKEPAAADFSLWSVRSRILSIASRDKQFFERLSTKAKTASSRRDSVLEFSSLASNAIASGDIEAASRYVLDAIQAEPTQSAAAYEILYIAAHDRQEADNLLLAYISRLQTLQLPAAAIQRTLNVLSVPTFPNPGMCQRLIGAAVPPAGPEAARAYINYVLTAVAAVQITDPPALPSLRYSLVSIWFPLQQYAPDMIGEFMQLESATRGGGKSTIQLPSLPVDSADQQSYKAEQENAAKSKDPEVVANAIETALVHSDFQTARKLLGTLPDSETKVRESERTNMWEAVDLVRKGEVLESEELAEKLTQPDSILAVCPLIVAACSKAKNTACAETTLNYASKMIAKTSTAARLPKALVKLAASIAPVDHERAFELLEDAVLA
ncbi:MAG: hypothetical protein ACREAC_20245, partial [Blastocatellia bacterium]